MFESLPTATADPLLVVTDRFNADGRSDKIDLGVGVFRAADGASRGFTAVQDGEQRLVAQQRSKEYLPLAGDPAFLRAMERVVLGRRESELNETAVIQATGGTGAVRLGLELSARANPGARMHLGLPSWPNHAALVKATGLQLAPYRYLREGAASLDTPAVLAAASSVNPGDVFLLQGPCHNPSGLDLPRSVRDKVISEVSSRGGLPFIDVAYCGLAGGLEPDLCSIRHDLSLSPRALIAFSCSKSFGLYRERTAVLFAQCRTVDERLRTQGNLQELSRTLVSVAPAHGAAVVATILDDPDLNGAWRKELEENRLRILTLRSTLETLSTRAPALRGAAEGQGIFMLLPIAAEQIGKLERGYGIYLPVSGRINITGLKTGDPERLADALTATSSQ